MRFANPHICPSCGGAITGQPRCPHCDLELTSVEARQLWQTLLQADALLIKARTASQAAAAASAPDPATPVTAPLATVPPARSLSPGSVLLGLGALLLLVAGFIFITVTWGSLGVTGRALVLLAFTATVGALAVWVTGRRLRGSAEALWTVFLGLLTVDWFAAWGQGLFGLDSLPFVVIAVVWSAVTFVACSLIVSRSLTRVGALLVAPMVVGGLAPVVGALALAARLADVADWTPFWVGVAATLYLIPFLARTVRVQHGVAWVLLGAATGIATIFTVAAATVEAVDSPSLRALTTQRHGLPVALVVVAAILAGVIVPRSAAPAVVVAALGTVLLVALPAEDSWAGRGGFVVVSAALIVGALARGKDRWSTGCRAASGIIALGLFVVALPWVSNLLAAVRHGASGHGGADMWSRISNDPVNLGPWWLAFIVFGALTAGTVLLRWWPEASAVRPLLVAPAYMVGGIGVLVVTASAEPPIVLLAAAVVVVGAVLAEAPAKHQVWTFVGPALVTAAPVVPLVSRSATLVVWVAAAIILGAIAARSSNPWRREFSALAGSSWGLGAAGIAAQLAGLEGRFVALSLVGAAVVGLTWVSFLIRERSGRHGVEFGSALVGCVGLAVAIEVSATLSWQALLWTITGAALVALSFAIDDRRFFRWIGSGALGVAYVLRLVASDVGTVEAYTLPFAILLLGAGIWAMLRNNAPSSVRILGPGLTLGLLPSLPMALENPATLRALLLGIGALLVLALGVRQHWKAPFVAGAAVLAALGVANLGPYALAVPRWVLVAAAGAVLLGAGVTWEDRLRDGRAVARYVVTMG